MVKFFKVFKFIRMIIINYSVIKIEKERISIIKINLKILLDFYCLLKNGLLYILRSPFL